MRTAERLTGTIRSHRKSIAYLSSALVLASAGTASAATVDPVGHVAAPDTVPVAAEHHMPAHADARPAGTVAVVPHGSAVLAHPVALAHPAPLAHPGRASHPASSARPASLPGHLAAAGPAAGHRQHRPGRLGGTGRWQAGAHHGQAVLAHAGRPAFTRIAPAANRLLPVTTAGPQNFMPITPAQYANAATIVHQALTKRMGVRSAVIAVATAMQESRLLNLAYGTGDSLGLFQQQWDMGWGTPQQIMNPAHAAGKFLDALHSYQSSDPAWASQPLYQAAQGVQRSAFPSAYAQWERQAAQLTASVLHAR